MKRATASSLVLKIINLVLKTPEKPKLQGKAKMSKVSSYCGFTFHSFEKEGPKFRRSERYILALPIGLDTASTLTAPHKSRKPFTTSRPRRHHQTNVSTSVSNLRRLGHVHMHFVAPTIPLLQNMGI